MAFTGTVRHRPPRPRPSRRVVVILTVSAVVAATLVASAIMILGHRPNSAVTASSAAAGSDLQGLVDGTATRVRWRSVEQTTGAWVETSWSKPRSINRVRISSGGARSFDSARLSFSDGTSLLVSPDKKGNVDLSFPERPASSARLTVAEGVKGKGSVALAAFILSDNGSPIDTRYPQPGAVVSSTATGSSAAALIDGHPRDGELGAEWRADPTASSARATLKWNGAQPIDVVRLWGPTATAIDPGYTAAAALNGVLRFSDGSTVRISGIAGGAGAPTTIAFTPRMVTSVTAVLERTIPQATIALRAMTAYRTGDRPSIDAGANLTSTTPPVVGTCGDGDRSAGTPAPDVISLVCPDSGTAVMGDATLRVAAPAGSFVDAEIASGDGVAQTALRHVASASVGSDGTADLSFSTAGIPHGPFTVLVSSRFGVLRDLHVQLFNGGGTEADPIPPDDLHGTLVYDQDFSRAVSITGSGAGATYAAVKPEYWGGSQFGDAVFDDPSSGAGTFSVIDGALRIRAQPLADRPDPTGLNRKYLGGLMSSLRVGASGFSAQYGYYEARMMAPAGEGTWPAFWMMNDDSATKVSDRSTEVDAVELYGNRTKQTCHSTHNYVLKKDSSSIRCIQTAIANDWAVGWHTYGVQIGPGEARFYVDGKQVMTQSGLTNSQQPFFFMANLALGGGWPVDLTPTGDRAELWIDYVRVWV